MQSFVLANGKIVVIARMTLHPNPSAMQKPDSSTIPQAPGVYLYKDDRERVIYVGKARILRRRVLSYFRPEGLPAKTRAMLAHAASLDYLTTTTEKEALLLEASLIKSIVRITISCCATTSSMCSSGSISSMPFRGWRPCGARGATAHAISGRSPRLWPHAKPGSSFTALLPCAAARTGP